MERIKILVVGCGSMGSAHARAYHSLPEFELVGLVSRGGDSRTQLAHELGLNHPNQTIPQFENYVEALAITQPNAVSINTYPDSHALYARMALESGAHVFVEKPLGTQLHEAEAVFQFANKSNLKVVVGYILQHHPAFQRFISIAQTLGNPLVMRMNLNQQSAGRAWQKHQQLLASLSPIVDAGVHYLDIMCEAARSQVISVQSISARLSEEIPDNAWNYGQLQLQFENGCVGWFESGWGPMVSKTAPVIRDIWGPEGSVSLVQETQNPSRHILRYHRSEQDSEGSFVHKDEVIEWTDEPTHLDLCRLEQAYFLKAIQGTVDLSHHQNRALNSLRIALAAEESIRSGKPVLFP